MAAHAAREDDARRCSAQGVQGEPPGQKQCRERAGRSHQVRPAIQRRADGHGTAATLGDLPERGRVPQAERRTLMDWIVLHRNGSPVAVNINLIVTFFEPTFANVPFKTRLCFQAQDDYMDVDETCKEISGSSIKTTAV